MGANDGCMGAVHQGGVPRTMVSAVSKPEVGVCRRQRGALVRSKVRVSPLNRASCNSPGTLLKQVVTCLNGCFHLAVLPKALLSSW